MNEKQTVVTIAALAMLRDEIHEHQIAINKKRKSQDTFIRLLRENGHSLRDIARYSGLSHETVNTICKKE